MRILPAVTLMALFVAGHVSGQSTPALPSAKSPVTVAVPDDEASHEWSFSASASTYLIPDDRDYVSPMFTADRDWLHLEARHNYEALDTASLWVGYNFSFGEKLVLDFTPMVGGVFGHTRGIAPGWRLALSKGAFELSSESEFVFDAENSEDNFFYTWSELTWSPTDWFWVGLVAQRTRAYETSLDIQRGFLLGFSFKKVDFTTYVFNWDVEDPTIVFSIGIEF